MQILTGDTATSYEDARYVFRAADVFWAMDMRGGKAASWSVRSEGRKWPSARSINFVAAPAQSVAGWLWLKVAARLEGQGRGSNQAREDSTRPSPLQTAGEHLVEALTKQGRSNRLGSRIESTTIGRSDVLYRKSD
jgi:hypothetical protein